MKLSNIILAILLSGMGAMVFAITQIPAPESVEIAAVPIPTLKPVPKAKTSINLPQLRFKISDPEAAGSYARLSLDEFISKGSPSIGIRDIASIMPFEHASAQPVMPDELLTTDSRSALAGQPIMQLTDFDVEATATPINLDYVPNINNYQFTDRIVDMAESSPLQPDARSCGPLKSNLKSAPKHAKVRSVGMERQLTDRTSIGVEYVYKDGCYKNAIATLKSLDMPSDDGVNVRLNVRF